MSQKLTMQSQNGKQKFVVTPELMEAEKLRADKKPDEALRIVASFMNDNFNHVPALVLAAHILMDAERYGLAHPYLMEAAKIEPDESIIWNNLGLCYMETEQIDDAEKCFIKGLSRNPNDDLILNNLAKLYNQTGRPEKAVNCSEKAISLNPKIPELHYNLGVAKLALGSYEEGWKGYEFNLGKHAGRRERVYGQIPRWTGVHGLNLIAYGEQGVGDEISFASCIPDLIRGADGKQNNVVIECDPRLVGIFERSFKVKAYGTRYHKQIDWPSRHEIDASVAFGSLPGFFRKDISAFPGTPYLEADPLRRVQWRALLDALGPKPKVGITWTGGIQKTGTVYRSLLLTDLLPILKQRATFISLQYKDSPEVKDVAEQHNVDIHHFPHATQTKDMDDQAALMKELDLVITVQQTAVHLGGALGVPTWVMIPKAPLWRYGVAGDKMPWYNSVKLYRQSGNWINTIAQVATDLRNFIQDKK